jgi:hemoglobin/transferrin/lactoferrin receptor protein
MRVNRLFTIFALLSLYALASTAGPAFASPAGSVSSEEDALLAERSSPEAAIEAGSGPKDSGARSPGGGTRALYRLEEIVVTASRTQQRILELPYAIHVIAGSDLQRETISRTVPEALRDIPGVMVQKTSHGQGSPYLRGFTGYRTLFLVDGIRLNNSVFRDGPNQYWNTLDALAVARMEMVEGPGSVLYGSDAIGGTVNAIDEISCSGGAGDAWRGKLYYRYASAERANMSRVETSGSLGDRVRGKVGLSLKDFGDVIGGRDVGSQPKTGYGQYDGDLMVEVTVGPGHWITFAHQLTDLDDAWRTHKTIYGTGWEGTSIGDEKKRTLDQKRALTYLQYHASDLGRLADKAVVSLSYHRQEEDQYRVKANGRGDRQGFNVGTVGAWLQMENEGFGCHCVYGLEYYRDNVDSYLTSFDADGNTVSVEIQGPVADDATYDIMGVFLEGKVPVTGRLDATLGIRYSYAAVDAQQVKDPVTGSRISVEDSWDAFVGNGRLALPIGSERRWRVFAGVSQGFRAPNLSDLTRFDTARSNEIETPAPDLAPEHFIAYEAGLKGSSSNSTIMVAYFYTVMHDLIIRTPTGRVIGDDIEVTKRNASSGYVQGLEVEASLVVAPGVEASGGLAWLDGVGDTYPTSEADLVREPIDRLAPTTGVMSILCGDPGAGAAWLGASCRIAAAQQRLSTRDKADTQRIPPGGTPGYTVFGIRGGFRVGRHMILSLALDNITNEDYRIHGSGVNEPGRNFVSALEFLF